jgi:hypothetical protein
MRHRVSDSDDTLAPESEQPSETPEPEAAPKKRFRFPWKTTIALAVFVFLALPVYSTLQPKYYERYPQMHTRIDNWETSTHARISCADCHVDPGAAGFLTFAARSIPAFYSQLIFGPSTQNLLTAPHRAACQKCHTDYRQVSPAGDLLIPHKAHVETLHIECSVCHKNLVHSKNQAGFNAPEMQTCLKTCHNGVTATNQCSKCHTRKQVPPGHLDKNWLDIHPSMVGKLDCAKCHGWAPDFCRQCHMSKLPPSHQGNWKQNHQYRVKVIGAKACEFCHGAAFCKKCH